MPRVLLLPTDGGDGFESRRRAALRGRLRAVELPAVAGDPPTVLRRALTARGAVREADVVHAFGGPAMAAAVLGGAKRIVFEPRGLPGRRTARWLRAASGYCDVHVVAPSEEALRRFILGGVPENRCTLVRPGADLGAARVRRDDELRSVLGFGAGDVVLAAPLEEPHEGGRPIAFWAASLLNVLDPKFKLLLTRSGDAAHPTDALRERLVNPGACVIVDTRETPLERALSAADAVLLPATGPVSMAAVAVSMASGWPVVASATRELCELLEDRRNALLVREPTPRLLAQRVLDLLADPPLAAKLADRARADVYESLTLAKTVELYRQVYDAR